MEIVVQNRGVSFEKNRGLTKGQEMLLQLLIDKVKAQEIISRDDIKELYMKVEPRKILKYVGWDIGNGDGKYRKEEMKITDWGCWPRANQWFKTNLATCIIKGKIIAVPLIEE